MKQKDEKQLKEEPVTESSNTETGGTGEAFSDDEHGGGGPKAGLPVISKN